MSEVKRIDRRILRTRALLRDALMELVVKQAWETITVQDITDRANVNRATFYLHYRDKDELLLHSMIDLYRELSEKHQESVHAHDQIDLNSFDGAEDFEHVAEHAEFYRAMLSRRGSAGFIVGVIDFLHQMYRDQVIVPLIDSGETHLPVDFMAAFLAGAEVGVVYWWLQRQPDVTPQEMARMTHELATRGLVWAMKQPPIDGDDRADPP